MKTALEQLESWIEQFYKINGTPTLDDIKGQINLLKDYETEQLAITRVVGSADVNIIDSDIATIEALHDLLLDAHGYSLELITLKRARELTDKMYKALY